MTFEFVKVAPDGSVRSCWAADVGEARWRLRAYPGTVSSAVSHRIGWPSFAEPLCTTCGKESRFEGRAVCQACHRASQLIYHHRAKEPKSQNKQRREYYRKYKQARKASEANVAAGIRRRQAKRGAR